MLKKKKSFTYSPHPGYLMEVKIIANLKEKTGRDLAEWKALIKKSAPGNKKECAAWLKSEFGLGTNQAAMVAARAFGARGIKDYDPEALVDAQYAGKKKGLRPIYESLLQLGFELGGDVRACPAKKFAVGKHFPAVNQDNFVLPANSHEVEAELSQASEGDYL